MSNKLVNIQPSALKFIVQKQQKIKNRINKHAIILPVRDFEGHLVSSFRTLPSTFSGCVMCGVPSIPAEILILTGMFTHGKLEDCNGNRGLNARQMDRNYKRVINMESINRSTLLQTNTPPPSKKREQKKKEKREKEKKSGFDFLRNRDTEYMMLDRYNLEEKNNNVQY